MLNSVTTILIPSWLSKRLHDLERTFKGKSVEDVIRKALTFLISVDFKQANGFYLYVEKEDKPGTVFKQPIVSFLISKEPELKGDAEDTTSYEELDIHFLPEELESIEEVQQHLDLASINCVVWLSTILLHEVHKTKSSGRGVYILTKPEEELSFEKQAFTPLVDFYIDGPQRHENGES